MADVQTAVANSDHVFEARTTQAAIEAQLDALVAKRRADQQQAYLKLQADYAKARATADATAKQSWDTSGPPTSPYESGADTMMDGLLGKKKRAELVTKAQAAVDAAPALDGDVAARTAALTKYFADRTAKAKSVDDTFKRIATLIVDHKAKDDSTPDWANLSDAESSAVFDYLTAKKLGAEAKVDLASQVADLKKTADAGVAAAKAALDAQDPIKVDVTKERVDGFDRWDKKLVLAQLRGHITEGTRWSAAPKAAAAAAPAKSPTSVTPPASTT